MRRRGRPLPHRRHAPAERRQHPSPDFQAPAAVQARLSAGPDRGDRRLDGTRRPQVKWSAPLRLQALRLILLVPITIRNDVSGIVMAEIPYFKALNPLLYVALNLHCRFPLLVVVSFR